MNKSTVRFLVVLVILALFPFISWFYLQKGIDYRMEAISELGEFGQFEWIDGYDERGRFIDAQIFSERFIIASVLDGSREELELLSDRFIGLFEQFGSREEVLFVNIIPSDSPEYNFALELMSGIHTGGFHRSQIVMTYTREEINQLIQSWNESETDISAGSDFIYLFDPNGIAIQVYNFKKDYRIARLVEHVAMSLPKRPGRTDYSDAIRDRLN